MSPPSVDQESCLDVYPLLLSKFRELDQIHDVNQSAHKKWGYTLTQAADEYKGEVELLPGLQELRGGDGVVGEDGVYYMGAVNGVNGLDDGHRDELNAMINDVEPDVGGNDIEGDNEVFAWFSDEESPEDFNNADMW